MSALSGAIAGRLAGPINLGGRFNPASPWLDNGLARTLNEVAAIEVNIAFSNLMRNVVAGTVSNISPYDVVPPCEVAEPSN